MNDTIKIKLIDELLANYYECGYNGDQAAAVLDCIFVVETFQENDD